MLEQAVTAASAFKKPSSMTDLLIKNGANATTTMPELRKQSQVFLTEPASLPRKLQGTQRLISLCLLLSGHIPRRTSQKMPPIQLVRTTV